MFPLLQTVLNGDDSTPRIIPMKGYQNKGEHPKV